MDLEKFTERSRGFFQAAQGIALRNGNQQLTPEHLLRFARRFGPLERSPRTQYAT